jgi:quinol monooxygenase YgiN
VEINNDRFARHPSVRARGHRPVRDAPELATQTRAEDGCIEYLFGRDLLEPDLIQITECWESEAAIELHKTTDHFRNFMAAMPQMLGFSRRAYTAEPVTEAKTSALSA